MANRDVGLPVTFFRSEHDRTLQKELDAHNAALSGWALVEHKDDGTHATITADKIKVIGDDVLIEFYRKEPNGNLTLTGQIDQTDLADAVFQSYTPVWSTSGTQPAIVNGLITARYQRTFGNRVEVYILLAAGSSTTFGTGVWEFSTPSAIAFMGVSSAVIRDFSVNDHTAMVVPFSGTTVAALLHGSPTPNYIDASAPMTWGNLDTLTLNFVYWE